MNGAALAGACHCGAVTLRVPHAPDYLNQCNCTVCTKLGTLWGYYPAAAVAVAGDPATYVRADQPATLGFGFCATCGAATHWYPLAGGERVGINMRLFEPNALVGIEVRYGDRRNNPAGEPRSYARAPTVFGAGGATP